MKTIWMVMLSMLTLFAKAQVANTPDNHRFSAQVGIGNLFLYGNIWAATEYVVLDRDQLDVFIRASAAGYAMWEETGRFFTGQVGVITGADKHHLEGGLGGYYAEEIYRTTPHATTLFFDVPISATLGWRIQKPGGRYIFRLGASIPEMIYVGFGMRFF